MIDRFYQRVKIDGRYVKVLDFSKIAKEKRTFNVILSERSKQGKTFNILEYLIHQYKNHGHRAVWIFNTRIQLERNLQRLISPNKKVNPKKWRFVSVNAHGIKISNKWFVYFETITTAYLSKSGRDPSVKNVVYDEFNEGLRTIQGKQGQQFSTIIRSYAKTHSNDDYPQFWIFGNQKTMAVPLLSQLGIVSLDPELQLIDKHLLFYAPSGRKGDIIKMAKRDPLDWFDLKVGVYQATIFNVNIFDNMIGVVSKWARSIFRHRAGGLIMMDGLYFREWIDKNNDFYLEQTKIDQNSNKELVYIFHSKDFNTFAVFNLDAKMLYRQLLTSNRVRFDSYFTKATLLNSIK